MNEEKIEYMLVSPSGNATAIVFGQRDVSIAKKILLNDKKVEQVIFAYEEMYENNNCWHGIMAGNELCINALRALGYLLLKGENGALKILSSGIRKLVEVKVNNKKSIIKLDFNDLFLDKVKIDDNTFLVLLNGITHLVVKEKSKLFKNKIDTHYINELISLFELKNYEASGIMFLDSNNNLNPYVYVRDVDTLISETACGSGSIACGIVQYEYFGFKDTLSIKQPSSFNLDVSFEFNECKNVFLEGETSILGQFEV